MSVRSVQFTPYEEAGLRGIPVNTEPEDIEILPDEDDDESIPEGTDNGASDASKAPPADTQDGNTGEAEPADSADTGEGDPADGDSDAAAAQEIQPESADSILASYEAMDPDYFTGEDMEKIGAALRGETETARDSLPEGSPTIGLMAHAIFQDMGSTLNPLDLISSIDDAEDSIEYIFGQIHVEGNAGFTTDFPGKYVFRYYVIDSDGNQSNIARLYIVVR